MSLVLAKQETALSLTRVQHAANDMYEILKAGQQWSKGEIDRSLALSIIKDRVIKTTGSCVGATAGAALGSLIIASTSWWNPISFLIFVGTTWAGCALGHKAGEILSSGFDLTGINESFSVLGLEYTTEKEKVRARYLQLARTMHPDKGGSSSEFQKLNKAYSHLTAHFAFNSKSQFQKIFSYMVAGISWLYCAGATPVNTAIATVSTAKKILYDEK